MDVRPSRDPLALIAPRLLTRAQAAAFVGVSVPTFTAICPIRPIALGTSKRLERYDIIALSNWIESLSCDNQPAVVDWLDQLDVKDADHPGEGNKTV